MPPRPTRSPGPDTIAMRILASFTCATLASVAHADTLYVDAALTTGANDGSSWSDAFQGPQGLQDALAAADSGDDIYVAQGTYFPGPIGAPSTTSFVLDGEINIWGGFAGGELTPGERPASGLARTVLSGDIGRDDQLPQGTTDDNARHVIVDGPGGTRALLDGLIVTGGSAWVQNTFSEARGAGLHIDHLQSDLAAKDCWFIENDSQYGGAGAAVEAGTHQFVGCIFASNSGGSFGGGLLSTALSPVLVDQCRFYGNEASFGGGLVATSDSPTTVRNTLVARNTATGTLGGGGVAVLGVPSLVIGPLKLEHCTIAQNESPSSRAAGVASFRGIVEIASSILWDNVDITGLSDYFAQVGTGIPVIGSIVQGSQNAGTNLDVDPMFVDDAAGDFRLTAGSPAIDAGDDFLLPLASTGDGNGQRRRVDDPNTPGTGAVVDIGAYEFAAGALGTIFCQAIPNSSGNRGQIDAYGSRNTQQNNVTLRATKLPPGQFGIFIVSRDARFVPGTTAPNLCLSSGIGRLIGPGQVLQADASGRFSLQLDVNAIPIGGNLFSAQPGESWSFQAWHRDIGGSHPSSNLTDGTTVTFE